MIRTLQYIHSSSIFFNFKKKSHVLLLCVYDVSEREIEIILLRLYVTQDIRTYCVYINFYTYIVDTAVCK